MVISNYYTANGVKSDSQLSVVRRLLHPDSYRDEVIALHGNNLFIPCQVYLFNFELNGVRERCKVETSNS